MNPITRRINVRAIIYRGGQLLAVRHKRSDGSAASYYAVPGGGLEPGESLTEGLAREIYEETGIHPQIGRLMFMQQFISERVGYDEELEFFYHIKNPQDFTSLDLTATSHGADEIAICEFIDPKSAEILPPFLRSIDIESYITQVREPYLYVEL